MQKILYVFTVTSARNRCHIDIQLTILVAPSSETQGQLVGAGERLNRRGKKSGEESQERK